MMQLTRLLTLAVCSAGLVSACVVPRSPGGRTAFPDPVATTGSPQQNEAAVAEIRRQVGEFEENELLRVIHHDRTESWGCLKGTGADGFRIGAVDDPGERILYADVAAVQRASPSRLEKVVRGILSGAAVAAVWFGVAKIGGDTGKTRFVKVQVGLGLTYIILGGDRPPHLRCG